MQRVFILRGLPGSGKSHWAKQFMEAYPGQYKRISKNDLRGMIDNNAYNSKNERFVLHARNALILEAIHDGFNVIVDDTNLDEGHIQAIRDLVAGQEAIVEVKSFTDVPLEECIKRDKMRENSVGEKVIRGMYKKYLYREPESPPYIEGLPDAVITDLDGTLNGRNPYDASLCEQDLVNVVVRDILAACGAKVLLVTGSSEKHRAPRERWLAKHGIEYAHLFMRQDGDNRKDGVVKQEIYAQHIAGKYNIRFVLDDRKQSVAAWRALGLTVLQVADGDY